MQRDGRTISPWQVSRPGSPTSPMPTQVDVAIVGGGVTGVSTALSLQQQGLTCVLLEAHSIGFGTTGGTSAHINTILDLPYDRMIDKFGLDNAKLVAQGVRNAGERIRIWAQVHAPGCAWRSREGHMMAFTPEQVEELERIVQATRQVGCPANFIAQADFPSTALRTACFPDQAQFHPLRYLHGLVDAFIQLGGSLQEHCRVLDVDPTNDHLVVSTERGSLRAAHVVYATHIPPGVNILHFRNAPYRSYVLAARLEEDTALPDALVYDMEDPYHYYRSEVIDGVPLLIAGGCDHKTGHDGDTRKHFRALEAHVRHIFPVREVTHRWSSQYFEPADGLPYIGRLPLADERIHVATGFSGNGFPLGTLASSVLTDLIVHGDSPYATVFDPGRVSPIAGFANFVKEAADVVGHLIQAPLPASKLSSLADLAPGDARVVQFDGRRVALHRDLDGVLHALDAACSHIKCTIEWNGGEGTWDCPCHGSRFSVDGEVLCAPARKPLQRINLEEKRPE
ncbi:MAG: FAD-dependent oxidoreductase [Flavobacteriales bacterium]